jgi:DNA-binding response OmpR family regulator
MNKKKLLIIEDDASLIDIFKTAIDEKKYDVIIAAEGEEGFKKAVSEKPGAIILDILLPGKNGFDVLIDLKNSPKTKKIPVIILSNIGQEEEVKRGLQLGADDYLIKADFTIDQVLNKIDQIVKN